MTQEEFDNLKPGDVLRHENGAQYMVMSNDGAQVVASSLAIMTNPPTDWELISKVANRQRVVRLDLSNPRPIKVDLQDKVVLNDQ